MILTLSMFLLLGLMLFWSNKQEKKRHEERIFWERKRVEATEKLSKEMKEYARHTIELESTKIWMRGMIDQMHTHGKKIDEFMDAAKAAEPLFVSDEDMPSIFWDDKGNPRKVNFAKKENDPE